MVLSLIDNKDNKHNKTKEYKMKLDLEKPTITQLKSLINNINDFG